MKKITIIFFVLLYCTQYTSKPLSVNPAIILSPISGSSSTTNIKGIEKTSTGHILRLSAQNYELIFKNYRIYQAPTEEQVLNLPPSSGTDCGPLLELPNTSKIYIVEASTNPQGLATLCTFPINLITGNYVSIRVVFFNGIGQEDGTSLSSNAVLVP